MVEKSSGDEVSVRSSSPKVVVSVSGRTHELERSEAVRLRRALSDSLVERREFVHTTGIHRADGTYVVSRRGADSAGHRKVFRDFEALENLYESLPGTFTASDVRSPKVTGSRRHLVVRHFAEHPAFECTLVSRQPLTAEKNSPEVAPEEL